LKRQRFIADTGIIDALEALYATLIYHSITGFVFYTYSYEMTLSSAWLMTGSMIHFTTAAAGLLLVMFGQGPGRISKRTGADKRTSGFPFKNREAEKKKL